MALKQLSFPSSPGAVLEALKGDISKEESHFQSLIITLRVGLLH